MSGWNGEFRRVGEMKVSGQRRRIRGEWSRMSAISTETGGKLTFREDSKFQLGRDGRIAEWSERGDGGLNAPVEVRRRGISIGEGESLGNVGKSESWGVG